MLGRNCTNAKLFQLKLPDHLSCLIGSQKWDKNEIPVMIGVYTYTAVSTSIGSTDTKVGIRDTHSVHAPM